MLKVKKLGKREAVTEGVRSRILTFSNFELHTELDPLLSLVKEPLIKALVNLKRMWNVFALVDKFPKI